MNPTRLTRWLRTVVALVILGLITACTTHSATESRPKPLASSGKNQQTPLEVGVSTNMPPLIYNQKVFMR